MRLMDPTERIRALIEAEKIAAGREAQRESTKRVRAQAGATLLGHMFGLEEAAMRAQADIDIAEIGYEGKALDVHEITSTDAVNALESVGGVIGALRDDIRSGAHAKRSPEQRAAHMSRLAEEVNTAIEGMNAATTQRGEIIGVRERAYQMIETLPRAEREFLTERTATIRKIPPDVRPKRGAGAQGRAERVFEAAEALTGLSPQELIGDAKTTTTDARATSGAAPAPAAPTPAQTPAPAAPAPATPTQTPTPAVAPMRAGSDDLIQRINDAYSQALLGPLGGTPIHGLPGFTRDDPRAGAFSRGFDRLSPSQQTDALSALALRTRGGAFPARSLRRDIERAMAERQAADAMLERARGVQHVGGEHPEESAGSSASAILRADPTLEFDPGSGQWVDAPPPDLDEMAKRFAEMPEPPPLDELIEGDAFVPSAGAVDGAERWTDPERWIHTDPDYVGWYEQTWDREDRKRRERERRKLDNAD